MSIHGFSGSMGATNLNAFDGYYAGAMIGVNQLILNAQSSRSLYFSAVDASDASLKNSYQANGVNNQFIGAFYLGYGQLIPQTRFYFGGEGFLSLVSRQKTLDNLTQMQANSTASGTLSQDFNTINSSLNTKLNTQEFALDLKPGFLIDVLTMLYSRVGMAFNKVELTENDTLIYTNLFQPPLSNTSNYSQSSSSNQIALRLGVGLERFIYNHFAITADYIYTGYRTAHLNGTNPSYGQDINGAKIYSAGYSKSFSVTPYANAIFLGLKYHA